MMVGEQYHIAQSRVINMKNNIVFGLVCLLMVICMLMGVILCAVLFTMSQPILATFAFIVIIITILTLGLAYVIS